MRRHRLITIQRTAAKVLIAATLTAMLLGAPFRRCCAEEGREHSPPDTNPLLPFDNAAFSPDAAPVSLLSLSALRVASPAPPVMSVALPQGDALVRCTVTHSFWRSHEHYIFAAFSTSLAADRTERQRRQVAIHLGRAISRRGDGATATRIEMIYRGLRIARWGRHADGKLGGHFNFDYSSLRALDLDRMLPHARYGRFASLHFHHDQERVHVDTANPFGLAGALVPIHFFVDVVAGHLPWTVILRLASRGGGSGGNY